MPEHAYQRIEVVGSSPTSIEDAIKNAVDAVTKQHKNLRWLEVVETRAHLEQDRIAHWQVTVRIGVRAN
jgi:flavin-binding protein dodecin